jgi:hypothetical protein
MFPSTHICLLLNHSSLKIRRNSLNPYEDIKMQGDGRLSGIAPACYCSFRIQTSSKNTKWATLAKDWPTHSSPPKKKNLNILFTSHNPLHITLRNEQCLKFLLGVCNTKKRGDRSISPFSSKRGNQTAVNAPILNPHWMVLSQYKLLTRFTIHWSV